MSPLQSVSQSSFIGAKFMRISMVLFGFVFLSQAACRMSSAEPTTKPSGATPMPTAYVRLIDPDGKLSEPAVVPKLVLSEEEWKKRLTPEQFKITRGAGTEPAFCGGLLKN